MGAIFSQKDILNCVYFALKLEGQKQFRLNLDNFLNRCFDKDALFTKIRHKITKIGCLSICAIGQPSCFQIWQHLSLLNFNFSYVDYLIIYISSYFAFQTMLPFHTASIMAPGTVLWFSITTNTIKYSTMAKSSLLSAFQNKTSDWLLR